MILVAGGTGTLGTQLVRLLTERGRPVRVLTRDPGRAAQLPGTVETITGDVRDPATVAAAVAGCTTVVSAVHGFAGPGRPSPESVDRDGNRALIQAAAAAGAEHVVLVSVLDAAPDHPMSLHRAKFAAEQALRTSGLAWTIVRPAAYLRGHAPPLARPPSPQSPPRHRPSEENSPRPGLRLGAGRALRHGEVARARRRLVEAVSDPRAEPGD